jgi:hypothetical protein
MARRLSTLASDRGSRALFTSDREIAMVPPTTTRYYPWHHSGAGPKQWAGRQRGLHVVRGQSRRNGAQTARKVLKSSIVPHPTVSEQVSKEDEAKYD